MSRCPLPRYPNGWFQVAYSDDLKSGGVLPLRYFGRDLVLFRSEAGEAHVLDAHCPHLGAHLGYGGTVKDGCIRCPFHAWRYDGTGQCVEVPYAPRVPPKARVRPWHMKEVNGLIVVWHHMRGEPPAWDVPSVSEVGNPDWTPFELRRWKIKTHNQEMAENSVDSAHFHYVHGTAEMQKSTATAEGHILRVLSSTVMKTPMGKVKGSIESTGYGFGYSLTRFTGIVDTLIIAGVTPIDDEYVDVRFSFTVKKLPDKDATTTVYQAFIREIERQLGQDIPIWENKVYVNPPLVVENDGPLGIFRRWSKQFYSETPETAAMPVIATA